MFKIFQWVFAFIGLISSVKTIFPKLTFDYIIQNAIFYSGWLACFFVAIACIFVEFLSKKNSQKKIKEIGDRNKIKITSLNKEIKELKADKQHFKSNDVRQTQIITYLSNSSDNLNTIASSAIKKSLSEENKDDEF